MLYARLSLESRARIALGRSYAKPLEDHSDDGWSDIWGSPQAEVVWKHHGIAPNERWTKLAYAIMHANAKHYWDIEGNPSDFRPVPLTFE
jgi:hypothetical protein